MLSYDQPKAYLTMSRTKKGEGLYSMEWMLHNRPHIARFTIDLALAMLEESHIGITAPPKSGKRLIMILLALLTLGKTKGAFIVKHVCITSLGRKDTKEQARELSGYEIEVFRVRSASDAKKALKYIEDYLGESPQHMVFLHIDESDYGTGDRQCLKVFGPLLSSLRSPNETRVRAFYYSATNQELLFSELGLSKVMNTTFVPPPEYRGPAWFLDQGLVHDSKPFFDPKTQKPVGQGVECLDFFGSKECRSKFAMMLRIQPKDYKKLKEGGKFERAIRQKWGYRTRWVDQDNPMDWSDINVGLSVDDPDYNPQGAEWQRDEILYNSFPCNANKVLYVVCQTCSRSTEVGFHRGIALYHDHREDSNFNTMFQAYGRMLHYSDTGHRIRFYGYPPVLECGAERITEIQFIERCRKDGRKTAISTRVPNPKSGNGKRAGLEILGPYDYPMTYGPELMLFCEKEGLVYPKRIKTNTSTNWKSQDPPADLERGSIRSSEDGANYFLDGPSQYVYQDGRTGKDTWREVIGRNPTWEGKYFWVLQRKEAQKVEQPKTRRSVYCAGTPRVLA